jgi:cyclopropane-fatty-acyl-phospholipid synthase
MNDAWLQYIPDPLLRFGIRNISKIRLKATREGGVEASTVRLQKWHDHVRSSPIAIDTKSANEQHYEVPAKFFELSLGKNLKYSSAYFQQGNEADLNKAEEDMLALSCARAQLEDGQQVLELGCGWGSLTLHMAQRYPQSKITGVSNSNSQREFIMAQAKARGLDNVEIITADMNHFEADVAHYDRVMSVEMFEHMRNWSLLMEKIHRWLKPSGQMFVHIFTHRFEGYAYEAKDATDWMSQYFFTGGQMPSAQQFAYFQDHLRIEQQWGMSGTHYEKTSNVWLSNMDANKDEIMELFKQTYGKDAKLWFTRWRIFYMSCAEFFGLNGGDEWFVSHYRFSKRALSKDQFISREGQIA